MMDARARGERRVGVATALLVALLSAPAAAAPPEQTGTAPPEEKVEGELEAYDSAAVAEPAAAPAPAATPSSSTPKPEPAEPQIPKRGTGLITAGSLGLVAGTGLYVMGSVFAASRKREWGYGFLGGTPLLIGGSLMVWAGNRRLKKFRAWSEETGITPPPTGYPLLIAGLVATGGSAITMIAFGAIGFAYCPDGCGPANEWVWLGPGLTGLGAGVGMTIAGIVLRVRHKRWIARRPLARVHMLPTFSPIPGGAQFGIAGKF